ncbi:MAG: (d)CMP kinase [Verrucomicrobiota bacterium]|nr:(d)CMP kinase [Verrucomicrobiota bacterium]
MSRRETQNKSESNRVIAIDGPAASGKSTVGRRLAAALGCLYVDSGALYRGVTWKALREGLACRDTEAVKGLLARLNIRFHAREGAVGYLIDGVDPGPEIRTQQVDENVSPIAAMPEVRARVNEWLRGMLQFGDLVVDGRDIGAAVFPDAAHKFYLNAAVEVRARRRHAEMTARNEPSRADNVRRAILTRDQRDSTRKKDPLTIAPDAVEIDSTELTIDEAVAAIRARIEAAS